MCTYLCTDELNVSVIDVCVYIFDEKTIDVYIVYHYRLIDCESYRFTERERQQRIKHKVKMMRERQTHMIHKGRVLHSSSWTRTQCNTNTTRKTRTAFHAKLCVLHGEEQLLSNTAT